MKHSECLGSLCDGRWAAGAGCKLDGGAARSARGSATLRPARALTLGRRTCYRLRLTNITPLPTAVHFDTDMGNTRTYITNIQSLARKQYYELISYTKRYVDNDIV